MKVKGVPITHTCDQELYGRKLARSQKRNPSYDETVHKKNLKVRRMEAEKKLRKANEKFLERKKCVQKELWS